MLSNLRCSKYSENDRGDLLYESNNPVTTPTITFAPSVDTTLNPTTSLMMLQKEVAQLLKYTKAVVAMPIENKTDSDKIFS